MFSVFVEFLSLPRATYACHGGDDNHTDVPDEQHDRRQYVDVYVSKCILDAQVDEAVGHGAGTHVRCA